MLRWQLILFRTEPIVVGDFASAEVTYEQLQKEQSFGDKIPMVVSLALDNPAEKEFALTTKKVFAAFGMKDIMVVNGTNKVNIFCRTPCINIDIKAGERGEIMIVNNSSFDLTEEQSKALEEFIEFLGKKELLYRGR